MLWYCNLQEAQEQYEKIPTRIEFIGTEELGEKAIMNPTNISMVLA